MTRPGMDREANETLELLIERYLNGNATPAQVRQLDDMLCADPEARKALLFAAAQDGAIRDALEAEDYEDEFNPCTLGVKTPRERQKKIAAAVPVQRGLWWVYSGVAAACLLLIALYYGYAPSAPMATLSEAQNSVLVERAGARFPSSAGFALLPNDVVKVPAGGAATLVYPSSMRLKIGAESTLVLGSNGKADDSQSTNLFIEEGSVAAQVDRISDSRQVVFYTPEMQISAHRAEVKMWVRPEKTQMDVNVGTVQMTQMGGAGKVLSLQAGNSARSTPAGGLTFRDLNSVDLKEGLTGYWKLNGADTAFAVDLSVNRNHGTLTKATPADGNNAGSLYFNGVNSHVTVNHSSALELIGEVTVSAWIKLDATGRDQKIAGMQDGEAGGYKLSVFANNKVDFEIRDEKNVWFKNRYEMGGTELQPGIWYHVAGTYSDIDGVIKTYVNGRLDRKMTCDGVLSRSKGKLTIGGEPYNNAPENPYSGYICEVRVYDRVLNGNEISTLARGRNNNHSVAWLLAASDGVPFARLGNIFGDLKRETGAKSDQLGGGIDAK